MNSWSPIFGKIVYSSLWAEPDHVCKVFITLLALKDRDHVVRYNAYNIGRMCWPMDPEGERKAAEALEILSSPDHKRLTPQEFEGRRIERVEDGWLVLNGELYRREMSKASERLRKAEWQRKARAEKRAGKAYRDREGRFVEAVKAGEEGKADEIAAEGLPGQKGAEGVEGDIEEQINAGQEVLRGFPDEEEAEEEPGGEIPEV